MIQNLENALHGVQEARTAIMIQTADGDTLEQEQALEDIQTKLNEVEDMIKAYGNQSDK